MTYNEAKQIRDLLDAKVRNASRALAAFPNDGPMGLTPDHVKSMPEWQAARSAYLFSFEQLRTFNGKFLKAFKREVAADRRR